MIIWVYDRFGNQINVIKDFVDFVFTDELGTLDTIEFDVLGDILTKGDYLVWQDEFSKWHEHIVRSAELIHDRGSVRQHIYAVNSISELTLSYINERDSYNFTNAVAWTRCLENTRWTSGTIDNLGNNDVKFYHTTVYDGILEIMKIWGGELSTTITVGTKGVSERRINHQRQRGSDNGLLFTYGFDAQNIIRKIELDDVYTKLHVFGKGEPTYGDDGTQTGNGRRIDFSDINGGKDYVEDTAAMQKWGVVGKTGLQHAEGTVVFDECEDKAELLKLGQEKLKEVSQPRISYTASVVTLANAGMEFKNAQTGDICYIRDKQLDERLSGRIIRVRKYKNENRSDEITLGNISRNITDILESNRKQLEKLKQQASSWDGLLNVNSQWLDVFIDGLNEQMNVTGGYVYIEPGDGITVYDKPKDQNPTMAIQLKGAGFRIANSKKSNGEWDWRTFGTGDGFTADLINVGVLRCGENTIDLNNGLVTFKNGVIQDLKSLNYINLGTGEIRLALGTTFGDKTVIEIAEEAASSEVNNFVSSIYDPKIAELQKQLDGQIESWFYDYAPTLSNKPASDWNTEAKKEAHEGDLFFNKTTGYSYRFFKDGNTWKWQMIQDTDITSALEKASKAQDTADAKRRVFVSTPNPPYEVGDLWVQGNNKTNGDLMRCQVGRSSGSYVSTDWIKAVNYTDDSALNAFIDGEFATTIKDLEAQDDKKAETWYQSNDPSTAWTTTAAKNEHIGDLWFNSTTGVAKRWSGTSWVEMTTNPPKEVFDEIDGKAQIFVGSSLVTSERPKPPYQIGDLWLRTDDNEIYRCAVAKTATGSYAANDWVKASKYTDNSALTAFMNGQYADDLKDLETQIDGKAETWYQTTDPSTSWTDKAVHKGDLWYNANDSTCKRWSGTAWVLMDIDPPADVFNTINGKAQIFITTPTAPYDVGDLYIDGTQILVCIKARASGNYLRSEWDERTTYMDTSEFTDFLNGQFADLEEQVDGKIETWSQATDPSTAWNTAALKKAHTGDLWYNTSSGIVQRWSGSAWVEITADPPASVVTTINRKAQIFTTTPTAPYYVGDLYFQSKDKPILTCIKARSSGNYLESEWEDRNNYIDSSDAKDIAKTEAQSVWNLVDQEAVVNKLTNNGATQGIYTEGNNLYFNASYIKTGALGDATGNQYWDLKNREIKICDDTGKGIIYKDGKLTINNSALDIDVNDIEGITYCTCTEKPTSNSNIHIVKVASGATFTRKTGQVISVKFTYANEVANPRLQVGGSTAAYIRSGGAYLNKQMWWVAGETLLFVFDGTYWQVTDGTAQKYINSHFSFDANTGLTISGSNSQYATRMDANGYKILSPAGSTLANISGVYDSQTGLGTNYFSGGRNGDTVSLTNGFASVSTVGSSAIIESDVSCFSVNGIASTETKILAPSNASADCTVNFLVGLGTDMVSGRYLDAVDIHYSSNITNHTTVSQVVRVSFKNGKTSATGVLSNSYLYIDGDGNTYCYHVFEEVLLKRSGTNIEIYRSDAYRMWATNNPNNSKGSGLGSTNAFKINYLAICLR